MKSEFNGQMVIEFIGSKSKMYYFVVKFKDLGKQVKCVKTQIMQNKSSDDLCGTVSNHSAHFQQISQTLH